MKNSGFFFCFRTFKADVCVCVYEIESIETAMELAKTRFDGRKILNRGFQGFRFAFDTKVGLA